MIRHDRKNGTIPRYVHEEYCRYASSADLRDLPSLQNPMRIRSVLTRLATTLVLS
jgi:hypothetical protein